MKGPKGDGPVPAGASDQRRQRHHVPSSLQVDRLSQQLQELEKELEAAKGAEVPVVSNASKAAAEAKQRALAAGQSQRLPGAMPGRSTPRQ